MITQENSKILEKKYYPRYSSDSMNNAANIIFLIFIFIVPILVGAVWFIVFLDIPLLFVFYKMLSIRRRILILQEDRIKIFHTSNGIVDYNYSQIYFIEYKTPILTPSGGFLEFSINDRDKKIKAVLDVNSEEYVAEILNFLSNKLDVKVITSIDMELWGIYKVDNWFVVKVDIKKKKYKFLNFVFKKKKQAENNSLNEAKYYPHISINVITDVFLNLIVAIVFMLPIIFKNWIAIILSYIPLSFFLYKKLSLRRRITVLGQNSLKVFHISNWIKEYQYHQIYYIEYKTPLSAPSGGFLEFFIKDINKNIKAIFYVSSQEYAAEVLNFLSAKLDDKVVSSINMELWGIFREDNTFVVKPVQPKVFTDKKLVLGIQKKVKPRIVRRNNRYRRR